MPFSQKLQSEVYDYCNNHLADEDWYNEEFEFIEDESLRKRLIEEFRGCDSLINCMKASKQKTKT